MTNELEKLFSDYVVAENHIETCVTEPCNNCYEAHSMRNESFSQITQAIQGECLSDVIKLGECSCQNGNQYFGDGEDGMPVWGACDVCVVEGQYTPKTITTDDIKNFAKDKGLSLADSKGL